MISVKKAVLCLATAFTFTGAVFGKAPELDGKYAAPDPFDSKATVELVFQNNTLKSIQGGFADGYYSHYQQTKIQYSSSGALVFLTYNQLDDHGALVTGGQTFQIIEGYGDFTHNDGRPDHIILVADGGLQFTLARQP